jgi:hypothetical protein
MYDEKTRILNEHRDYRAQHIEDQISNIESSKQASADVRRFVQEALSGHETAELLRKSNMLSSRKLGKRNVNLGWALEGVLAARTTNSNTLARK